MKSDILLTASIFSFAIVMWEILTQQKPYPGWFGIYDIPVSLNRFIGLVSAIDQVIVQPLE